MIDKLKNIMNKENENFSKGDEVYVKLRTSMHEDGIYVAATVEVVSPESERIKAGMGVASGLIEEQKDLRVVDINGASRDVKKEFVSKNRPEKGIIIDSFPDRDTKSGNDLDAQVRRGVNASDVSPF